VSVNSSEREGEVVTYEMSLKGVTVKEPGRPSRTVSLAQILDLAREQIRLSLGE